MSDRQSRRAAMYGELDLSALSIFSGHFINYGHWANVDLDRPLTVADRTRSQADLYRETLRRVEPRLKGRLLEVGCGIGVGAALVLSEFAMAALHGIDLSADQLARAATINAQALRDHRQLSFTRANAQALPWRDESFDGVYSVEAAQHFDDFAGFAAEAHRVLKPGGRFAVAAFFAPGAVDKATLGAMLETVESGVDIIRPVAAATAALVDAGFETVTAEAIGEQVWPGLDRWMAGTEHHDSWGRHWYTGYRDGLVDYYLLSATRAG